MRLTQMYAMLLDSIICTYTICVQINRGGSMNDLAGNTNYTVQTHKWALPKDDVNSVDLYIPVMSFLTYCILICYAKKMVQDGTAVNTPDILINAVWKCCILQIFESVLISICLSMMSVSLPFLDLISYTGE